jgi:hypothetical protein
MAETDLASIGGTGGITGNRMAPILTEPRVHPNLTGADVAGGRADPTRPRPQPHRPEPGRSGQLVATAGTAIVTAARVGRLLGRTGWRIAKQLPAVGVLEHVLEHQAQRVRHAAGQELLRLLEIPTHLFGAANPEEQRVMMLVRGADADPAPLRTAMGELLERSSEATAKNSRDYLYGTIVSQLVPDEARILAALANGGRYAAVDVVAKPIGRSATRQVLVNASTVGAAAGLPTPQNTATYLTRLHGLGLVEFGKPDDGLAKQYALLAGDDAVRDARKRIESDRLGTAKLVRKTVRLSRFGRDFWAACAPDRPALTDRRR